MSVSASPPRLYPLFADLHGRSVLVVGGGVVARRKVEALLNAGARVLVVAPRLDPALSAWASQEQIAHHAGRFEPHHLDGTWLAIAATGDPGVNRAVAESGAERRIWVNVVDDIRHSRFHVPARVERGPLQIAISSGGGAPMLARLVRERLEAQFDESLGLLAGFLARHRQRIRRRWPDPAERRSGLSRLIEGPLQALLRKGRRAGAERALDEALQRPAAGAEKAQRPRATGSVALVGAGPGDPGLLTLRALRVLNEADVILHDHLVGDGVLELARRDAERIPVGKRAGDHHRSQEQINALLLEHARAGSRVVRLKGGDPFVFGRGGEELQVLREHGVDYEVVPGITAALACAAYAGVPLTHRDHAQSVRLVTAHCKASLDTLDWAALARERQTLAVYMGVAMLERLRKELITHGRPASTPFALVENGTRADQRVVTGTLASLPERARAHAVQSPALLIVGEVAAFADVLHWSGSAPLGAPPRLPLADAA